jgi:FkbM family methyltransferase
MKNQPTYVGDNRILLWTKNNYKMFVDARDVSIAPHLILEGVYEEHTDAVLRRIVKPGMRVLEIGANVGLFTLLMSHIVGTAGAVLAFECDPVLAQILRDNVELNGFQRTTSVDERAVSDTEGTLRFYAAQRHRGGGTLVAGLQQIPELVQSERREIEVSSTTADRILAEHPAGFNFVKIDAEGAEAAIVRGGERLFADHSRPLRVMLEFAPRFMAQAGADPGAFLGDLSAWGFRFERIDARRRKLVPASREALLADEFADIVLTRG